MKCDLALSARTLAPRIPAKAAKASKRTYTAPELRIYGSVRELTLGASGRRSDGCCGQRRRGSDRSIKENILRIGTHPLGIGLYLFEYKPDYREECGKGRYFGVMADEVESVLPQAVGRHARGHKTVDYAMLGIFGSETCLKAARSASIATSPLVSALGHLRQDSEPMGTYDNLNVVPISQNGITRASLLLVNTFDYI